MTHIREDMPSDNHRAAKQARQSAGDDAQKEQWYSFAVTVRALKASQAMSGSPADRRRGEIPVELRPQPSFLLFFLAYPNEQEVFPLDKKQVVITERRIGKVTYLVHASSSERATDTIHKKIEKLIVKDLQKKPETSGFFAS